MPGDVSLEDRLDDLDDLIRYLEKERERLKKCVEDAAAEWEFSAARAFAKTHRTIVNRLRVLESLRDPGFEERARYYQKLIFLEDQLKTHADVPRFVRYLTEQWKQTNQELDKLEKMSYPLIDTQYVDDAIFLLVNNTIDGFKLHLNKAEELIFDLVCSDARLQIGISYRKGGLFPGIKKGLRKIGFLKVPGSRRFVRDIEVRNFKDALKIKQLLAVVVFDVFDRHFIDNPAALEIVHKTELSSNTKINRAGDD